MADFGINNSANNFGRSAGLQANTLANRPTQAAEGTIFIDVDTLIMYRYNALIELPDWQIIGGGGSAFTGAQNGLNTDYGPVELGGELTKNTTIDISDYSLNFTTGTGWNFNFEIGSIILGLNDDEDGYNTYIEITDSSIFNTVVQSDSNNFVAITHNASTYNIATNEYYADWDDNNSYYMFTALYNVLTQIRCNYFNNDTGNTYSAAFTISNTMGAEGNYIQKYNLINIPVFTNNADAIANGLSVGDLYRHNSILEAGDQLRIVH